jgi:hypothetical protein
MRKLRQFFESPFARGFLCALISMVSVKYFYPKSIAVVAAFMVGGFVGWFSAELVGLAVASVIDAVLLAVIMHWSIRSFFEDTGNDINRMKANTGANTIAFFQWNRRWIAATVRFLVSLPRRYQAWEKASIRHQAYVVRAAAPLSFSATLIGLMAVVKDVPDFVRVVIYVLFVSGMFSLQYTFGFWDDDRIAKYWARNRITPQWFKYWLNHGDNALFWFDIKLLFRNQAVIVLYGILLVGYVLLIGLDLLLVAVMPIVAGLLFLKGFYRLATTPSHWPGLITALAVAGLGLYVGQAYLPGGFTSGFWIITLPTAALAGAAAEGVKRLTGSFLIRKTRFPALAALSIGEQFSQIFRAWWGPIKTFARFIKRPENSPLRLKSAV